MKATISASFPVAFPRLWLEQLARRVASHRDKGRRTAPPSGHSGSPQPDRNAHSRCGRGPREYALLSLSPRTKFRVRAICAPISAAGVLRHDPLDAHLASLREHDRPFGRYGFRGTGCRRCQAATAHLAALRVRADDDWSLYVKDRKQIYHYSLLGLKRTRRLRP